MSVQHSQPDFTESLQKLVEVEAEIQRQLGQPFNLTVREQQLALHYLQTAILCLQAATKAT